MAIVGIRENEAAAHVLPSGTRTYIMVLLTAIYTLAFLDRQIVNILAEPIKQDLGLADWQMGAMSGLAFALFYTALGLPIARLSERGNRSLIITVALVLWSAFTAASGLATNFVQILLARIGVGVGEAGCVPPAHSLISDITPREGRAGALAVFSMGLPLGSLAGMAVGGVVAHEYGWRMAFFLVGIPGLFLALLMLLTVRDPRMAGLRAGTAAPADVPPLKQTLAILWSQRSFVWLTIGASLIGFAGYAHQTFYASFFLRNHAAGLDALAASVGMGGRIAVLGVGLGLIIGVAGTLGTGIGGKIGDRNARNGAAGYMTVPIWATAISVPFLVAAFLVPSVVGALALIAVPSFLKSMWYGPVFASVQSLVAPRARATAVAVFLFVVNAVGLGLGPLSAGALSDVLARNLGPAEGLRVAMIVIALIVLAAAGCFAQARRTLSADVVS